MLEPIRDQAAGLLAWHLQPPTRVLAVLAAARGSASLELLWRLHQGCQALGMPCAVVEGEPGHWPEDLPSGGAWLWHAPANEVLRWWPTDGGRPLVALTAEPAALVAAYQDLKRLHGMGLRPVVIALPEPSDHPVPDVARGGEAPAPGPLQAALSALRCTSDSHLGVAPTVWALGYDARGSVTPETQAVLGRILDAAWVLEAPAFVGEQRRPC